MECPVLLGDILQQQSNFSSTYTAGFCHYFSLVLCLKYGELCYRLFLWTGFHSHGQKGGCTHNHSPYAHLGSGLLQALCLMFANDRFVMGEEPCLHR